MISEQVFQGWIGRTETRSDELVAAPLQGLSATLDHPDARPVTGDLVPPLGHWLFFLPQAPQHAIGPDGHPLRGGFLPPVPLPRRMWAGGSLQWEPGNPLRVGDRVRRVSRIESVRSKAGRSGELVFVQLRHTVHNAAGRALTETQDIVYREMAGAGDVPPPVPAPEVAAWQRELLPDPVLLFRYSALTFNGHRIHYDRPYAIQEEHYPGLVVQGPLVATLLTDLARRNAPGRVMVSFEFRAIRPAFDGQPLRLLGEPDADGRRVRLWTCDHQGNQTMQATATLA